MSVDKEFIQELREDFLVDSIEIRLAIRDAITQYMKFPKDSCEQILRALHNLKGQAHAVALNNTANLFHDAEKIFIKISEIKDAKDQYSDIHKLFLSIFMEIEARFDKIKPDMDEDPPYIPQLKFKTYLSRILDLSVLYDALSKDNDPTHETDSNSGSLSNPKLEISDDDSDDLGDLESESNPLMSDHKDSQTCASFDSDEITGPQETEALQIVSHPASNNTPSNKNLPDEKLANKDHDDPEFINFSAKTEIKKQDSSTASQAKFGFFDDETTANSKEKDLATVKHVTNSQKLPSEGLEKERQENKAKKSKPVKNKTIQKPNNHGDEEQYLFFEKNQQNYLLKTDYIDQLVEFDPQKENYLPEKSEYFSSIVNHKGTLIPILNFKSKSESDLNKILIICEIDEGFFAIKIAQANHVIKLKEENIQKFEQLSSDLNSRVVSGIVKQNELSYLILDPKLVTHLNKQS